MSEFGGADAIAVAALVFGIVKILTGPLGRAIADRVRGVPGPEQDLALEVDTLRTRLAEVEERVDFAERLLAQAREADQLHGGAQR